MSKHEIVDPWASFLEFNDWNRRIRKLAWKSAKGWLIGECFLAVGFNICRLVLAAMVSEKRFESEYPSVLLTFGSLIILASFTVVYHYRHARHLVLTAKDQRYELNIFMVRAQKICGKDMKYSQEEWEQTVGRLRVDIHSYLTKEFRLGVEAKFAEIYIRAPSMKVNQRILYGLAEVFNEQVAPVLSDDPELFKIRVKKPLEGCY